MLETRGAAHRRRRLVAYAAAAKKSLIPGLLLEALAVLSELLAPLMVARLLNPDILQAGTIDPRVYRPHLIYYFLLIAAGSVLRYLSGLFLQYTGNDIARRIQMDVFTHLQKLPMAYFDRLPAGTVVSRVTNDTKTLRDLFGGVLVKLITAGIFTVGIYGTLLLMDYRLFLLALIPLPLMYLAVKDFKRKSEQHVYRARRQISMINSSLNESISGMEVIQSLGREERLYKTFSELNEETYQTSLKLTKLWSYSTYNLSNLIGNLMLLIIIAYFGFGTLTARWAVPLGSLYVFIDYMLRLINQMNTVMQRIADVERAKGAANHIFELLEEPAEPETGGVTVDIQGAIEFRNVHFSYAEENVLQDIGFKIPAGQTAAFVGPTGSGKSTIMNLLFGFYPLDEGEILIDDCPLRDLAILPLRRQMAIVLQDPYLFTGTLYSNIAMRRPEITEEVAERALREVGGGALLDRLELGIRHPVTERGQAFSTGERQLISFARALARNPKILLLDEATANVDSETEEIIQNGIKRLEEGRTTVLIAHRLSTVQDASRIFVLDGGRIKERGSHFDLLAQNGLYARMYREQAQED